MIKDLTTKLWDALLDRGITEQTLQIITNINGYSAETLRDVFASEFTGNYELNPDELLEEIENDEI